VVSPTRRLASRTRSASRIVGTMAAGVVPAIYLYACAARPVPPPLPPPPTIAQPIQPSARPTPAVHVVKASWYGPGLAGKKTTSGEVYNPKALTAASKTLPIGSVVKVTNPQNGKSVNVRINDRGPFVPGRSLDLSQRAAEKIGVTHKGVARVKVSKVATPEQHDSAAAAQSGQNASVKSEGANDITESEEEK
jgi:rare lipoprotein A (peptidoglycan hydrolase)